MNENLNKINTSFPQLYKNPQVNDLPLASPKDIKREIEEKSSTDLKKLINYFSVPKENRNNFLTKECAFPYIMKLPSFAEVMNMEENSNKLEENLIKIISSMELIKIPPNFIYIKYNELMNDFVLLLKGNLSIIKPIEERVELYEDDYINYLIELFKNNEIELLNEINELNKNFSLELENDETFFHWMERNVNMYKADRGKRIFKYCDEIYEKMAKTITNIKKSNNNCNNDEKLNRKITPSEYLKTNHIQINNNKRVNEINNKHKIKKIKYTLSILTYYETTILDIGDFFGTSKNSKSNSTIISTIPNSINTINQKDNSKNDQNYKEEDYIYLVKIDKQIYIEYISHYMKLYKKFKSNFIFKEYNIFSNIYLESFTKKYLYMFTTKHFETGTYITSIDSELSNTIINNNILFVKSGEYEISISNKNLLELNEIIIKLKTILNSLNDKIHINEEVEINELDENNQFLFKKSYYLPEVVNSMFSKRTFKIKVIKDRDIFGLEDSFFCLEDFKKYAFFNCKCISNDCDCYSISRNSLNIAIKNERIIKLKCIQFSIEKIKFFLKRINEFKKNIIDSFNSIIFNREEYIKSFKKNQEDKFNFYFGKNIVQSITGKNSLDTNSNNNFILKYKKNNNTDCNLNNNLNQIFPIINKNKSNASESSVPKDDKQKDKNDLFRKIRLINNNNISNINKNNLNSSNNKCEYINSSINYNDIKITKFNMNTHNENQGESITNDSNIIRNNFNKIYPSSIGKNYYYYNRFKRNSSNNSYIVKNFNSEVCSCISNSTMERNSANCECLSNRFNGSDESSHINIMDNNNEIKINQDIQNIVPIHKNRSTSKCKIIRKIAIDGSLPKLEKNKSNKCLYFKNKYKVSNSKNEGNIGKEKEFAINNLLAPIKIARIKF